MSGRRSGFVKISGVAVIGLALLSLYGCMTTTPSLPTFPTDGHYDGRTFFNPHPNQPTEPASRWSLLHRFVFGEKKDTFPVNGYEVPELDLAEWAKLDAARIHFARLGHSSLLFKLRGETWLIDPVFSQRTSPVQWAGPKRFHRVPVLVPNLPPLAGVIISHDHYDHLDYATVQAIKDRVGRFVVPLGVGARLRDWQVDPAKISELDWQQATEVGPVTVTALPAQHFSGRGLNDRNQTLWASWVLAVQGAEGGAQKVYYSGDGGYSSDFKEIGERHGPFVFAVMETGAYDPMWPAIHMVPEETAQAFVDVRGEILVPVHNGTFDLAFHPWKEPFERISAIAAERGLAIATPEMGVIVSQGEPPPNRPWWRDK